MPVALIDHIEHEYSFVGNDGPVFYFKTDWNAPNGRVIGIDLRKPQPKHSRELIRETPDPIQNDAMKGDLFVVEYLHDVASRVGVFRLDGSHVRDVELPGKGSAGGFGGRRTELETFYEYTSFNTPSTIFRYDLVTGQSTPWRVPELKFDPQAYVV